MLEVLIYAVGVIATLMLTAYGSEDADFLACILALAWVGSNLAYSADMIHVAFVIDLCMASTAFWVFKNIRNGWRSAFLALCIYQLVIDAVFDIMGWEFYDPWARASNVIFVLQLAALCWGGAGRVWNNLLDRFRAFRDSRRPIQAVAPWGT